jgi:5-(carboxyamino)imidazole ribonucleotide mutase
MYLYPMPPQVGIIMGSASDSKIMEAARQVLKDFDIPHEFTIVSAHRTPERLYRYAQRAAERGLQIIIAGAGGAAHLPGMIASLTTLPVIGVPIRSSQSLAGLDSLLSIVQMPRGVPVATVAIDNAANAALLAVRILALQDPTLQAKLLAYQQRLREEALSPLQAADIPFDQPTL